MTGMILSHFRSRSLKRDSLGVIFVAVTGGGGDFYSVMALLLKFIRHLMRYVSIS